MQSEFRVVVEANEDTLTYFNKLFSEHESRLQEYKAKLFETNIRLDELKSTKNIYSLGVDTRKNIFSPIPEKKDENDKETQILREIEELKESEDFYENKIEEETAYLRNLAKRIKKLIQAKKAIHRLLAGEIDIESIVEKEEKVTEKKKDTDSKEEFIDLEAFLQ